MPEQSQLFFDLQAAWQAFILAVLLGGGTYVFRSLGRLFDRAKDLEQEMATVQQWKADHVKLEDDRFDVTKVAIVNLQTTTHALREELNAKVEGIRREGRP